ncbi:MAG TPA: 4Fe-4S ferredoxin [Clostridiales bacterium]|nr:4Fe-4S ferredoxin [Clostridiales bacterium]
MKERPAMAVFLSCDQLPAVLAASAERGPTWVAAGRGEDSGFIPYRPGLCLDREAGPTRRTLKEVFLPRAEVLFGYETVDGVPRLHPAAPSDLPRVIFGVRPCDARALALLDPVFEEPPHVDGLWAGRRQAATLVGLGCDRPGPACFCPAAGGDPLGEEGLDVLMVPVDGGYLVRPLTERGRAWTEPLGLPPARPEQLAAAEAVADRARERLAGGAPVDLQATLASGFEHSLWDRLHERCLGCAACTYLCPTCHCFDVGDEDGRRWRRWDSCMFPTFTLHASGHNPRTSGKERMRQRLMHKFCYYPERRGRPACVGCGRCVEICPANVDLRSVLEQLKGVRA